MIATKAEMKCISQLVDQMLDLPDENEWGNKDK